MISYDIKYVTSTGTEYSIKSSSLRLRNAAFHAYEWTPEVRERKYGERVTEFRKDPVEYEAEITVQGTLEERRALLDELSSAFDRDIYRLRPGRLYFNEHYIECFARESETSENDGQGQDSRKITIYAPYPFWIHENTYDFEPTTQAESDWLDYAYGYNYDFTPRQMNARTVKNDGVTDANMKITMYGPCATPYVVINGNQYKINITMQAGEYLEIDTKDRTIIKKEVNGREVNEFNARERTSGSFFQKLTPGKATAIWPGTFGVNIVVYEERSEPAWS